MRNYVYIPDDKSDLEEMAENTSTQEGLYTETPTPFFEVNDADAIHLYMKRPVPSWLHLQTAY